MTQDLEIRKAATEKCLFALNSKDADLFKMHIQNSFDQLGDTNVKMLLDQTVIKGWPEGLQCLLDHGADPSSLSLFFLARKCTSLAILELLAKYGMNFHSTEENLLVYVLNKPRDTLDWWLDQGLDINRGGNRSLAGPGILYQDNTIAVLNQAAGSGDISLFDYLVSRGAKADHSNALHNASRSDNAAAMITHLIETYKLDVNASDSCGGLNQLVEWDVTPRYPLKYAIYYSNTPAVEVLIKYGAEIGGACGTAIMEKNAPALRLLLEAGGDASEALGSAIHKDYLEGAEISLEYGGEIAVGEEHNRFVASLGGRYSGMSSEMRKLLDQWKEKRKETSDQEVDTAMEEASRQSLV